MDVCTRENAWEGVCVCVKERESAYGASACMAERLCACDWVYGVCVRRLLLYLSSVIIQYSFSLYTSNTFLISLLICTDWF